MLGNSSGIFLLTIVEFFTYYGLKLCFLNSLRTKKKSILAYSHLKKKKIIPPSALKEDVYVCDK